MALTGTIFERGDDGYEAARAATVWNARLPARYPDVVVQASNADDVVAAIRHAKAHGMQVGIRSGGHSWAASHVRDGGMLLDLSQLTGVAIDEQAMTAVVGPGKKGNELCLELEARDLFFPSGHCKSVAVGGYLLQGGYGWNSRVLGPACESVLGIDVVTADGELVHASATENAELYWAARGSGPGFFGVVVAFHVRLYPKPAVAAGCLYVYPLELLEPVYRWAHGIGHQVDRRVEFQMLMSRAFHGLDIQQPAIVIGSPVFAETEAEAEQALELIGTCPVRSEALIDVPFMPATMALWYEAVMQEYPDNHRYATDNMWTSAGFDDLLPGLQRIADTLPPPPSHALWMNWGPSPQRPDMAYSMEDDIYLALYGVWQDEADDAEHASWAEENMRLMQPHATGIQLADENLGRRPMPFMQGDHMQRLDAARSKYDPDGRFHAWMGRV